MRDKDRQLARRKLDVEMRPFRRALADKNATQGLLRAVRLALRIPMDEIAEKMEIRRSNVFYLEERELNGTIGMPLLARAARAMGCTVVYGIIPKGGKTLEELYEERLWAGVLGVELNKREREAFVRAAVREEAEVSGG